MPVEPVRLHTRDKRTVDGEADFVRIGGGAATVRALAFLVGGLVLGAGSIVIPVAHFVLPWLLPIVGVVAAVIAFRSRIKVPEVRVTCPECGSDAAIEAGAWEDPLWIRCPNCQLPLRVELVNGVE